MISFFMMIDAFGYGKKKKEDETGIHPPFTVRRIFATAKSSYSLSNKRSGMCITNLLSIGSVLQNRPL